jgi:capsular exopolysaccharide synthesis family protein
MQAKVDALPDAQYEITGVLQNQKVLQENLGQLAEKSIEAQFMEATRISNAKIVELAMEPGKKIKPRRTVNLIFGVMLGLFLGLAGSVFAETMDTRIHTREELERSLPESPVLAAIPAFTGDHPLVVHREAQSSIAEAFRTLRSSVRFLGLDRPLRSIVVTSPGFGEGKSLIAANLAAAMAQSGQRVILVDADLRKPSQHEILAVDNAVGLSNLLVDEASLEKSLKPTALDGLTVLPSGPVPPNPAELLDSAAMRRLAEALSDHADVVIYDTPPVAVVTDAAILGSLSEGAILVVGAGQTSQDGLARANKALKQARVRLLGLTLNRAAAPKSDTYAASYDPFSGNSASANGHRKSEKREKAKL